MPRRVPAPPIRPPAGDVLRFAEHVSRAVRKDRLKKAKDGRMERAAAVKDIALAAELARWARGYVLRDSAMN